MSTATGRFLVVKVGDEFVGLGLEAVREVVDVAPPREIPSRSPALRGVMPLRDRYVSLLHLGALLSGRTPPAALGDTAVVVRIGQANVALEVEGVEDVADRAAAWVGAPPAPWGSGVWQVGDDLVTVLDLGVLSERITESGANGDAG